MWCSPRRNRSCFMAALFFMFMASILSIVMAAVSLAARLFTKYSSYLNGNMRGMSFSFGLILGICTLCLSLFGCLLISRKYKRRCLFYWFGFLGFFAFVILIALGITIWSTGYLAARAIGDYCDNNYNVWHWKHMGDFVTYMDTTYSEIEERVLCSPACPCPSI